MSRWRQWTWVFVLFAVLMAAGAAAIGRSVRASALRRTSQERALARRYDLLRGIAELCVRGHEPRKAVITAFRGVAKGPEVSAEKLRALDFEDAEWMPVDEFFDGKYIWTATVEFDARDLAVRCSLRERGYAPL